jgi:hypothetical protein
VADETSFIPRQRSGVVSLPVKDVRLTQETGGKARFDRSLVGVQSMQRPKPVALHDAERVIDSTRDQVGNDDDAARHRHEGGHLAREVTGDRPGHGEDVDSRSGERHEDLACGQEPRRLRGHEGMAGEGHQRENEAR